MNNHGMALAAGLSYYFVLSLFPALIAAACIVPYLPVPNLWDRLLFAMSRIVPAEAMGLVQKVVSDVLAQTHPRLLSVGILVVVQFLFGAELNSELRKAAGKKPLPVKESVVPLELPKAA